MMDESFWLDAVSEPASTSLFVSDVCAELPIWLIATEPATALP